MFDEEIDDITAMGYMDQEAGKQDFRNDKMDKNRYLKDGNYRRGYDEAKLCSLQQFS